MIIPPFIAGTLRPIVRLPFTADQISGTSPGKRGKLCANVNLGEITQPSVVCSSDNIPLIWYFPGAIPVIQQVSVNFWLKLHLEELFFFRKKLWMQQRIFKASLR
jgi:hypothetical protein